MNTSKISKCPTSINPTPKTGSAMDDFIGGAPDATPIQNAKRSGGLKRGKREQISHTLPPELLERTDKKANDLSLTRAGLINLALSEFLNK